MKKVIKTIFSFCCVIFFIVACNKENYVTYTLKTGEVIKSEIDISSGYSITSTMPAKIMKNNEYIAEIVFIDMNAYTVYEEKIIKSSLTEIIAEENSKNIQYIIFCYNKNNYYSLVKIPDLEKFVFFRNAQSGEILKECIKEINFSKM